MAIAMDDLESILGEIGLEYNRDGDSLFFGVRTDEEHYRLIVSLEERGEYLGMLTWKLFECPGQHPGLDGVLEVLAQANADYKAVQLGWEPESGDVHANIALPVEDNDRVSPAQMTQMLSILVHVCDEVLPALRKAMEPKVYEARRVSLQPSTESGGGRATPAPPVDAPGTPVAGRYLLPPTPVFQASVLVFSLGVLLLGISALLGAVHFLWK